VIQLFGGRGHSSLDFLHSVLSLTHQLQSLPTIARTPMGKPFFPEHPEIQFSLSHSGSLLLCAVDSSPVGVDIEIIRPRREQLLRYALTHEEYDELQTLGGDWGAFYRLWTRKEAWAKYLGDGIGRHIRETPPQSGLSFGYYAGEGWRAAVCGVSTAPDEIRWLEEAGG